MKIGIDARSFGTKVCGVSRVTLRLIEALSAIDRENKYFIFTDQLPLPELVNTNFRIVQTRCPRMNPVYDYKFVRIASDLDLDVFHSVHSWLPFGVGKLKAKKIVTIHDVFALTDPKFFAKYGFFSGIAQNYFGYLTRRSSQIADMVITVSEYSKKRIQETIPVSAGKVRVVYNASGLDLSVNPEPLASEIPQRYVLYVGNCRSYKNVPTLIRGFAKFIQKNSATDLSLVIAGNDTSPEIRNLTVECGIASKVFFLLNPSDATLKTLYQKAFAFIMPSKEEGFGIPVLEAMSCGTPVIVSDADALLEVAGDAALVFPKDDPDRLADSIGRLQDSRLRSELCRLGQERSKAFSWEKSAEVLKQLYIQSPSAR